MLRVVKAASVMLALLIVGAAATPAPAKGEHTVSGTVIAVHHHKAGHATLTIHHNKGQHTFTIDRATHVHGGLHTGAHVTVAAHSHHADTVTVHRR